MIHEGLLILLIGIGVVFLFFTILTIAMKAIALTITAFNKAFPEKIEHDTYRKTSMHHGANETGLAEIALAIAVAARYKK